MIVVWRLHPIAGLAVEYQILKDGERYRTRIHCAGQTFQKLDHVYDDIETAINTLEYAARIIQRMHAEDPALVARVIETWNLKE